MPSVGSMSGCLATKMMICSCACSWAGLTASICRKRCLAGAFTRRAVPTRPGWRPVGRFTHAIERFPDDVERFRYYVRDLIAPRFFRAMASEPRKAVLKGTKPQQTVALGNLRFITSHLRAHQRLPLRLFVLPALRVPPLARFIMRHRIMLIAVCRRFF